MDNPQSPYIDILIEIAQRALEQPDTLTIDEIEMLARVVLSTFANERP